MIREYCSFFKPVPDKINRNNNMSNDKIILNNIVDERYTGSSLIIPIFNTCIYF